jgi:hypothetical protein
VRAAYQPIGAATAITIRIDGMLWIPSCANVAATATTIPAAPMRFPIGAVVGDDRKRRARMKATIAAR